MAYRHLKIGMPTCLQCRGVANQDIDYDENHSKKYCFDKAAGY